MNSPWLFARTSASPLDRTHWHNLQHLLLPLFQPLKPDTLFFSWNPYLQCDGLSTTGILDMCADSLTLHVLLACSQNLRRSRVHFRDSDVTPPHGSQTVATPSGVLFPLEYPSHKS